MKVLLKFIIFLAQLLKKDRDFQRQFAACFRVAGCLTSRETRKRDVKIRMENITSGKLCARLNQIFPDAEQVFLTAEDANRILSESANNILVDSFTDMKEVADPAAKDRIYSFLQSMLGMAQEKINSDSSKTWDSVFWNEENTRPDKVAKTLNETISKLDKDIKDRIKEGFKNSTDNERKKNGKLDVDAQTTVLKLVKANVKVDGEVSSKDKNLYEGETDKEKNERKMKEIADKVEWNGEKFVTKPMYLTRVNLSAIRNKQAFQDKEIAVSYSTTFLDLKMNVPEGDSSFLSDSTHSTIGNNIPYLV